MPLRRPARHHLNRLTGRIHGLPVLTLMPHSRCNCRCVMCDIWKANADGVELTVDDLAPHLDDIRELGVQWVILSGGEALMHSNLWRLCEMLRALNIKLTLLSTGILLKRDANDVARWIDEVIVSLDGSPDVHDRIRRLPRAFEKLSAGVAAVKSARDSLPVLARCVLQKENFRDFEGIVRAAKDIGVDSISFLAADVTTAAFNRTAGVDSEQVETVALSLDETDEFEAVLNRAFDNLADAFASGFIVEPPEKLQRLVQYYRALLGRGEFPKVTCNAPWVSAVLEPDGAVRPCFFHRSYGVVGQQTLKEMLNSSNAIRFRRSLNVASNAVCQKCVCSLNY